MILNIIFSYTKYRQFFLLCMKFLPRIGCLNRIIKIQTWQILIINIFVSKYINVRNMIYDFRSDLNFDGIY